MDIYHLRYFLAVAQRLNFTRAAEDLRMATSPLSRRIRDFERRLGVQLFERTPRRIYLTPAGRALVPLAREIVEKFDNLRDTLTDSAPAHVRVGVSTTTPSDLAEVVEAILVGSAPQSTVYMECDRYISLDEHLIHGDLDLAFHYGPPSGMADEYMNGFVLKTYRAGVIMRADDPLAARTDLRLSELVDSRFALLSDEVMPVGYQRLVMRLMASHGIEIPTDRASHLVRLAYAVAHQDRYNLTISDSGTPAGQVMKAFDLVTVPLIDVPDVCATSIAWSEARRQASPFLHTIVGRLRRGLIQAGFSDGVDVLGCLKDEIADQPPDDDVLGLPNFQYLHQDFTPRS